MKNTLNHRHRDFIMTCRSIIKSSRKMPMPSELARKALSHPARSYYIDEDYAYRMVLGYLNHGKTPTRPICRRMCMELVRRVTDIKNRSPATSTMQALKTVLESGTASRYFMADRTARNLIERNYKLLFNTRTL